MGEVKIPFSVIAEGLMIAACCAELSYQLLSRWLNIFQEEGTRWGFFVN
jgi:hypothetical protein